MPLTDHAAALSTSLARAHLVPGPAEPLIPASFTPTTQLHVSFDGKAADLGTFFRAGECKQAPRLAFAPEADADGASYTFVLADPDAPTPDDPKFAFWRHYVVGGLKPAVGGGEVQAGQVLTEFLGPGPNDECVPYLVTRFILLKVPNPIGTCSSSTGSRKASSWPKRMSAARSSSNGALSGLLSSWRRMDCSLWA